MFGLNEKIDKNDVKVRKKVADIEVFVSTLINVVLFFIKLFTGLVTGSFAMISDAFHTLSDIFSSIVIWLSFLWSSKPADDEHPFGHERVEYICGMIVAGLLITISFEFAKSSIYRILHPEVFSVNVVMLLLVLSTIILKEVSAQVSFKLGRLIDSKPLMADAWHHRTDALSSIVVLVAFILQMFGVSGVDGWAGLVVSCFILYAGIKVAKDSIHPLIGEPVSPADLDEIKEVVMKYKEVKSIHDVVIHSYGTIKAASLHIELDCKMTFEAAHDLAEVIEENMERLLKLTSVVIHIDPITTDFGQYKDLPDKVAMVVDEDKRVDDFHDLRLAGKKNIFFDVRMSKGTVEAQKEKIAVDLSNRLKKYYPKLNINVKVEPKYYF